MKRVHFTCPHCKQNSRILALVFSQQISIVDEYDNDLDVVNESYYTTRIHTDGSWYECEKCVKNLGFSSNEELKNYLVTNNMIW